MAWILYETMSEDVLLPLKSSLYRDTLNEMWIPSGWK